MKLPVIAVLVASGLSLAACKDAKGTAQQPATGSGSDGSAGSGSALEPGKIDESYVPAEHKTGIAKWKDVGVYLDGQPIGFIQFGELPITLKPVFVEDEVSVNKPPGCPECPDRKKTSMRYYRFIDYLKAVGIDSKKVKVLHVLAPKASQSIEATGADLQTPLAKDFMFRFGGLIDGKPISHTPEGFGNGETPDKMAGVMIYIERKPPKITREGIELDGVPQSAVPYYGEPLRGGVRIYLDDRLATVIKRQELDVKMATPLPDGELTWSFKEFLASKGIDASKVVEGWVIRGDRRQEKIAWPDLSKMVFTASSQGRGHIALGDAKIVANAIALHTRAIAKDDLPVIRPDEEW